MTFFDNLPIVDRINVLCSRYQRATGRIPTRIVLTSDDLAELLFWKDNAEDRSCWIEPPQSNEPEISGMKIRVDDYVKVMRVYFQES